MAPTPTTIFKKSTTTVTVSTKNAQGHSINGVSVKVSGAGITSATKTSASGKVTFKLHPTKAGTITITATKAGLQTGKGTITVL